VLLERIVPLLADDPNMTANAIQIETKARRSDVLRCVRILRGVAQSGQTASTS
jgi:hypothetical protein